MITRRKFFTTLAMGPAAVMATESKAEAAPLRKRVKVQTSPINGFQYYKGEKVLPHLRPGQRLTLRREPGNRHDDRAVEIYWRGHKLGYLPQVENTAVASMMDDGESFECLVAEVNADNFPWETVHVRVDWVAAQDGSRSAFPGPSRGNRTSAEVNADNHPWETVYWVAT